MAQDPELVGEWERETTCAELALPEWKSWLTSSSPETGSFRGLVWKIPRIDPAEPCKGAVPRVHSHFFTGDGEFGSRDWNGEDVDDGTWRADGETLVISKEFPDVAFRYRIDADELTLDPAIELEGCSDFRCSWSVAVAYPGKTWTRVE